MRKWFLCQDCRAEARPTKFPVGRTLVRQHPILLVMILLTACSVPLKSDLPSDQIYRLQPQVAIAAQASNINLYLPKIEVSPELDNAHITLIKPPNQQDFIARSRWPDNLSTYLHGVLLDALSRSGSFQSVSSQMVGKNDNYRLVLRVSAFQAEYPPGGKGSASVDVVLDALLVRVKDQRLLGQHRYAIRKDNVPVSTSKIVAALDQALGEGLAAMVVDLHGG